MTSSAPDIDAFLSLPPPREGADAFLSAIEARLATSRKTFLVLFGGITVVTLVACAIAARDPLHAMLIGGPTVLGVSLFIGVPSWLYVRQDLSIGRRLLREGTAEMARVTSIAQSASIGVVLLTVQSSTRRATFRTPLPVEQARALQGQSARLLHRNSAIGVWLDGHGMVVTR